MRVRRVGFFGDLPHGDVQEQRIRDLVAAVPQPEEPQIIQYLKNGILLVGCPGVATDVMNPSLVAGSPHVLTDGEWAWPGDLPYYVEKYHVRLPSDFVLHMKSRRWEAPRQDRVSLDELEPWPVLRYTEAKALAEEAINQTYGVPGDQLVVIDSSTIEKDYGWVFFYDSRRFLEGGNESHLIAGNAPLIVEKDGTLHWLGTAKPVEEYLAAFDAHRGVRGS